MNSLRTTEDANQNRVSGLAESEAGLCDFDPLTPENAATLYYGSGASFGTNGCRFELWKKQDEDRFEVAARFRTLVRMPLLGVRGPMTGELVLRNLKIELRGARGWFSKIEALIEGASIGRLESRFARVRASLGKDRSFSAQLPFFVPEGGGSRDYSTVFRESKTGREAMQCTLFSRNQNPAPQIKLGAPDAWNSARLWHTTPLFPEPSQIFAFEREEIAFFIAAILFLRSTYGGGG